MSTLEEVAKWSSGGTPKARTADYYGGAIPWAVIGDLNDGPVTSTAATITQSGLDHSSAKWLPPGAILVAMYGSIGKLGIATMPLTTNQAIAAAIPDPTQADTNYLYFYLMAQRHELGRAGKGAAQQNIGQGILKAWPIPMAPLEEQRRIVRILEDHLSRLDKASALAASTTRRLIALRQSAREEEIARCAGDLIPLGDYIERVEAGKSVGGSAPPAAESEWGIIKVSAMTWGEFRGAENKRIPNQLVNPRYEVRPGDLLVSRANTSTHVGASVVVGRVRPRLLLSDKSLRLVPMQDANARWLNEVLQAPSVRRQISAQATGTKDSMRNISHKALLSVLVPSASSEEQDAMLGRLTQTSEHIERLGLTVRDAQTRSDVLRRSLLAAAFAGRLTGEESDIDRALEDSETDQEDIAG